MHNIIVLNPGIICQELVEIVLDFLGDDLPSLLACALVHRTWTHPAQALIFSRVSLRRDDGRKLQQLATVNIQAVDAFCALLSANPHLPSMVCTMQLRSKGPALFTSPRKVMSWWLPLKSSICPLMPQLTRLERLELRYERIYGWNAFVAWDGARAFTLESVHLRTLDLRTVTFEDTAAFLQLLCDVNTLEMLFLQGIAFIEEEFPLDANDPLPIAIIPPKRPRLKSLSIHGMPRHVYDVLVSAFLHPDSPIDIRFLRSLELHWYHNAEIIPNVNAAAPFLSRNQKTLEHLSTCESFQAAHLRPVLEAGRLRTLQLTAFPTASVWLDRMQATFTGISLRSLQSLTVDTSGQYSKFCLRLDSARWRALDEILTRAGLPNLVILIVRSQSQYQSYWDLDWAEQEDFRGVLPLLHSRDALHVDLDILDM